MLPLKQENIIWEEVDEQPRPPVLLLITKEKIELKMSRDGIEIVKRVLERKMQGDKEASIRLAIHKDLKENMSKETIFSIKKFMLEIEHEAPDIVALLDWEDRGTIDFYRTYLLPQESQDQIKFVRERIAYIFGTCELMGTPYRVLAESFVSGVGLFLDDDFFIQFENWIADMEFRETLQDNEEIMVEESIDQVSPYFSLRFQFSREEVEKMDIQGISRVMDVLLYDPLKAKEKKNAMIFSFYGFSGNLEDLLHHPGVLAWASYLIEKYPFIFYFLNDEEVPMTRFLTSLVVSSTMRGDILYFNQKELEEFLVFIHESLMDLAFWVGDNPEDIIEEFHNKLFVGEINFF